jgi:predicted nucleic acid-binding protein
MPLQSSIVNLQSSILLDILHVAAALALGAEAFLTFDHRQPPVEAFAREKMRYTPRVNCGGVT